MLSKFIKSVTLLVSLNVLLGQHAISQPYFGGLRLSGGENSRYGRLEIEYSPSKWGTLCNSLWDWNASLVACQQLSLGPPLKQLFSVPLESKIPIAYSNILCQGNESHLLECGHSSPMFLCQHSQDVAIQCAPSMGNKDFDVVLVDNGQISSLYKNLVLIYYANSWNILCHYWPSTDTDVLCHQLGYDTTYQSYSMYTSNIPNVFRGYNCLGWKPYCLGSENHLDACLWNERDTLPEQSFLHIKCEAIQRVTAGPTLSLPPEDTSLVMPLWVIFFITIAVTVFIFVIFRHLIRKGRCLPSNDLEDRTIQPQIQVLSVRSIDEDDIIIPLATPSIQELPDDTPPTYEQYVTNPELFRPVSLFSQSQQREDRQIPAEDTMESPPPDYDDVHFNFEESGSEMSYDTRL